jgi:antitoxin component YwqK of YwqJK toxin-antitoxin module
MSNTVKISSKVLDSLVLREKKSKGGVFTVKSIKTGKEYSYKIGRSEFNGVWFTHVKVEQGTQIFKYLGWYKNGKLQRKKQYVNTPAATAIAAVLRYVELGKFDWLDEKMELYHEGKCLTCGRPLTDSDSIKRGIGPVCAGI